MSNVENKTKYENFSYEEAKNTLFSFKEQVIDLKNENNTYKDEIKRVKAKYTSEKVSKINKLTVELNKSKTTYKALKTNTEFTEYVRSQKRKALSINIKELKQKLKVVKKNLTTEAENNAFTLIENKYSLKSEIKDKKRLYAAKDKKAQKSQELSDLRVKLAKTNIELKTIIKNGNQKLSVSADEIVKLEKLISENNEKIKNIKSSTSYDRKLLKSQMRKQFIYNNLADEQKEIKNLEKNGEFDGEKKASLLASLKEKRGKILKFQANSLSYWLVLLVVFIEVLYTIFMLNQMYVDYMVFPSLIVNLIFILMLFLSALKIKTYSSFWTNVNYGFSIYLVLRIFVVIPFVCKDREAVYEDGKLVVDAISYGDLRTQLIVCTLIMLVVLLVASLNSSYKIKNRVLYLEKKEA